LMSFAATLQNKSGFSIKTRKCKNKAGTHLTEE